MDNKDIAKLCLEVGALIGSLTLFFKSRQSLAHDSQLFEFFKTAYSFSPKVLIDILEENYKGVISKNLLNFTEDELSAKFMGFVKGEALAHNPIKSVLTQTKNLIFRKVVAEPIYTNTKKSDPKDYIIKTKKAEEFLLKDSIHNNNVLVKNTDRVDSNYALKKLGISTSLTGGSFWVYSLAKLIFTLQLILSLLRIHINIKGWRIGQKITEFGIKNKQQLLSFGKIVYDKKNKLLLMDKPYYILRDKFQIIKDFKSKVAKWTWINRLSVFMAVLSFVLTIRRGIRLTQKIRKKMQDFIEQVRMNKLKGLSMLLTDSFKCIICIDNPKNIIFTPCYHMALCKTCFDHLEKKICPICRKGINDIVKIFIV